MSTVVKQRALLVVWKGMDSAIIGVIQALVDAEGHEEGGVTDGHALERFLQASFVGGGVKVVLHDEAILGV